MELLDLPLELLKEIFEHTLFNIGLYDAVKIRLVCKVFDREIENAISTKGYLEYIYCPVVTGNWDSHMRCIRYLGDPSRPLKCSPHVNIRFLTRYLYDRVVARKLDGDLQVAIRPAAEVLLKARLNGDLQIAIRQTVEVLLKETGETSDASRKEFTMELCKAATVNLGPSIALGNSATRLYLYNEPQTLVSSHHTLVAATALGVRPLVSRLLAENGDGVPLNCNSLYFGFPLQVAAERGNLELTHPFLNHGMDVNQCNDVYGTILQRTAFAGHGDIVKLLLKPEYHCNIAGDEFDEAILWAARGGHVGIAVFLLGHVTTVRSYDLETIMLCEAARYGREHMAYEMLRRGARVELGPYGIVPKHEMKCFTITKHKISVSEQRRALVQRRETIHMFKAPPLILAASEGHAGVLRVMLAYRKANNQVTKLEESMTEAIKRGYKAAVQVFLDYGADINNKYHSPLKAASKYGRDEMLVFLLERGLNPLADVKLAKEALQSASESNFHSVIGILKRCGVGIVEDSLSQEKRISLDFSESESESDSIQEVYSNHS